MANEGNYKGITVKFGADTSSLGKALRDIDTQAKGVNADLKEIQKGLKLDPKNLELTGQKFQRLSEGIQLTQRRLEMLRSAQADARRAMEDGTEGADARYRDLQREIARTENELNRLRVQIRDTSEAFKKDLSESVEVFAGQIKTAAVTAGALVTALGGIAFSTAKTADDFNTMSKVTGISTEELQKFSYASKLIDVDVSTLQSSLQRLTRNMQSAKDGTGAAAEAFSALKINIKNSSGELRNNADIFYEVVDALGQVENVTERDAYAMNIFGRSAQDLNPLIIAGSKALKDFGEQAENMGIIFDQQTLDNMNALNDKLDISKQQLKGASMIVGGELLDSFNSLFGGADRLLKLVQQARDDGTLAEIADAAASAVEGFISVISSAVKFIYEFRGAILSGVEALIAYKAAVSISNIIKALVGTLKLFTAATAEATAAQQGMNAAAAVNPYAVIAAAAVLAINAIGRFVAAQYEANAAFGDFFDKVTEEFEKNNEAVRSYDELSESIARNREERKRTAADIEGEYYGYEKLIARLYELDGAENKDKAVKAEMAEIVEKLQKGVDGLTIAYNKETGELTTQRNELEKATEATKEFMLAKAAAANQEGLYQDLANVEIDKGKLDKQMDEFGKQLVEKRKEIAQKYSLSNDSTASLISQLTDMRTHAEAYNEDSSVFQKEIDSLYELQIQLIATWDRYTDTTTAEKELNEAIKDNQELIDQNAEKLEEWQKKREEANKAEEEAVSVEKSTADAAGTTSKAYEEAEKKAASYKGEVEALIDLYQRSAAGVRLTTSRMNDLIDRYPELIRYVRRTSDGYKIEAEEIENLIEQKSKLMLAEKQEAEELARKAYEEAQVNYVRTALQIATVGGDEGWLTILRQRLEEAKELYDSAALSLQGYESVVEQYINKSYANETESSDVVQKADTTDYWKQAAEAEIIEAEHLYKMGEIKAEEYYSRLEDINKRYYDNRAEYIKESYKLEETVYSGLKKIQEEQLSNTKTLLDRINAVREARRELERAESQQVNVYSAAAGFHAEKNTSAIDSAAAAVQAKELELASILQQKFGGAGLEGFDPASLLPDLSGIRLPQAAAQRTVNVDYHAGNIYISGSADSGTVDKLREMLNSETKKFFDEYLNDYIERADMDRQTGG